MNETERIIGKLLTLEDLDLGQRGNYTEFTAIINEIVDYLRQQDTSICHMQAIATDVSLAFGLRSDLSLRGHKAVAALFEVGKGNLEAYSLRVDRLEEIILSSETFAEDAIILRTSGPHVRSNPNATTSPPSTPKLSQPPQAP